MSTFPHSLTIRTFSQTESLRSKCALGGYFSLYGHAYDKLGEILETVKRICEDGAHQFLRKGNCDKDITS
jgi:hypothetical protein